MPLSVFQGAPLPREGEPLFTQEDHDWFIALSQERRDTCPSCGLLKSICRDPDYQLAFEPREEQCNATWRLAQFRESDSWKNKHPVTQQATQVSVRFREGMAPPLEHGLDLQDEEQSDRDQADKEEDHQHHVDVL